MNIRYRKRAWGSVIQQGDIVYTKGEVSDDILDTCGVTDCAGSFVESWDGNWYYEKLNNLPVSRTRSKSLTTRIKKRWKR